MDHKDYAVDILDQTGAIIATKPRKDVDKTKDIYRAAYVMLVTPQKELLISCIPERADLPNLYAQRCGITVATILRSNEAAPLGAQRALRKEVGYETASLRKLSEGLIELDGHRTYATFFYTISSTPAHYSRKDISQLIPLKRKDIERRVKNYPEEYTPTFLYFWKNHRQDLPL